MQRNHIRSPGCFSLVATILISLAAAFGSWSCSKGDDARKVETITIGVPPLEQNALLYVADRKRFFSDHGLHVVIRTMIQG